MSLDFVIKVAGHHSPLNHMSYDLVRSKREYCHENYLYIISIV